MASMSYKRGRTAVVRVDERKRSRLLQDAWVWLVEHPRQTLSGDRDDISATDLFRRARTALVEERTNRPYGYHEHDGTWAAGLTVRGLDFDHARLWLMSRVQMNEVVSYNPGGRRTVTGAKYRPRYLEPTPAELRARKKTEDRIKGVNTIVRHLMGPDGRPMCVPVVKKPFSFGRRSMRGPVCTVNPSRVTCKRCLKLPDTRSEQERAFHAELDAKRGTPEGGDVRDVYADWLEDQGRSRNEVWNA